MTNTCINYQTILPPVRGEHLAIGDTGVVIYSNSVMGARSNFEGGPSALAAGLTGRTPRYGYHLDAHRAGTSAFRRCSISPRDLADWGALGGIVGRATNSYWEVPVVTGLDARAQLRRAQALRRGAGELRLGGAVPHAGRDAGGADASRRLPRPRRSRRATRIGKADFEAFYAAYAAPGDKVDVVVFAAPQLSLIEMQQVAGLLDGRRVHRGNVADRRPPRPRSSSPPTAWA